MASIGGSTLIFDICMSYLAKQIAFFVFSVCNVDVT